MMPFLCDQLEKVVQRLMLMFVIHEDVNKAKFAGDLALVKFYKTKHQFPAASVKLPTAKSSALRSADADKALKFQFKAECKQVLVAILENLWKGLLRHIRCVNCHFTEKNGLEQEKLSVICDTLFDSHYVSSEDADKAKEQYFEFLDTVVLPNWETFLAFNIEKHRLDTFLAAHVNGDSSLWNVMIFAFTMFHGQSKV